MIYFNLYDIKDKNYIELNNVYIYIVNNQWLSYTLFDKKYIYIYSENNSLNEHQKIFDISKINMDDYEYLYNNYHLFLYQTSLIPSHNYHQILLTFEYLINNKITNILSYDTDNKPYNNMLNFITNFIINNKNINNTRIKCNKLYKINRLRVGISNKINLNNNLILYKNLLDNIVPSMTQKKYYNLKIVDKNNLEYYSSPSRCFTNFNQINNTMTKNNFTNLSTYDEYEKQVQLRNSSMLILNWGGNHVINAYFSLYLKNKSILILCHIGYEHEYRILKKNLINTNILDTSDYGNKIRYVFDLSDDICNLDDIIKNFEDTYKIENKTIIANNNLKDIKIYKELNFDIKDLSDNDAINQYQTKGIYEGRICDINIPEDFDINIYKELNIDLQKLSDIELQIHYIKWGISENKKYKLDLPVDFDVNLYKELNADLYKLTDIEIKKHYDSIGRKERRCYKLDLPVDFDVILYKELNIDLQKLTDVAAKIHYNNNGKREGRIYKLDLPLDFNVCIYKEMNNDLQKLTDIDAKIHYNTHGINENRLYKFNIL
jgi:hypothetical protein